jgi:16S rRNA processing protein RimM
LGIVEDIERFTAQDYLQISTSEIFVSQNMPKSFLLPYSERYIDNVDIKNKKISVKNAKDILEAS